MLDRFWSKVDSKGPWDCWNWKANKYIRGYGQFAPRHNHPIGAHIIAFELSRGREAQGVVMHLCDNPLCCNPCHLEEGSHADNIRDRDQKGRQARGERNRHAKLTAAQVRQIRESLSEGRTQESVALQFGVKQAQISNIALRKSWKHI